ncbi:MAG TPA: multicopper oxidase domain-containing protein [Polyangiaceae bacterium]|nr:multicopper oxidase domain-containing protein [Polyangiaceae bacterium]
MVRARYWHAYSLLLCAPALASCGSDDPFPYRLLEQPDVYTSVGGVLHLRVTAKEVTSSINHEPYKAMLVYETSVVDGQGQKTQGNTSSYIGPQWNVKPGDKLIIDYVNALPQYRFDDIDEVIDPDNCTEHRYDQPLNLHTHGLTVSPAGNADNVLLSIPPGRSNRYVIDIPKAQHHGLYWYHPHIHGISDTQVYNGLAGHIVVGRADGDYKELDGIPTVPMMIRYNVKEAGKSPCINGWLIDASASDTHGTALTRDGGPMVYTVNGLVAPRVPLNAADPEKNLPPESQVWALSNITGSASYLIAFDEVERESAYKLATTEEDKKKERPLDIVVVSVDGSPLKTPIVLTGDKARSGYHLAQGGRVALLVQGASNPNNVVRMIQVQNRSGSGDKSAFDWENKAAIGGYRHYTRGILAVGVSDFSRATKHVDTPAALTPNYEVFHQGVEGDPVLDRTFVYGSVLNPTPTTPNSFPIDGELFPNNPVHQPRVGTVERWIVQNHSSLLHPFHFHTQYAEVERITAPAQAPVPRDGDTAYTPLQYIVDMTVEERTGFTQDVVDLPPAGVDADGNPRLQSGVVAEPGEAVMRLNFLPYLGTYVEHCHRLPHEDRGMMSLVRTIPERPVVAVAAQGKPGGSDSTVTIMDPGDPDVAPTADPVIVATLTPFAGFKGGISAAVGDVDGDAKPDVAAVAGTGQATSVVVYSGASGYKEVLFSTDLPATDGPSVALSDLNADLRDEIILGEGSGGSSRVVIHDGRTGDLFDAFSPYEAAFKGAVHVAAGLVEEGGRTSLFTAPGAGRAAEVMMFNYDLFGDATGKEFPVLAPISADRRHLVATFNGADASDYQGGLAIAVGYPRARWGGFADVLTSTLSGSAKVQLFKVQMHDHGSGAVAASGWHKAFVYSPSAGREVKGVGSTDLSSLAPGLGSGAVIGLSSTVYGAELLSAPPGGGPVLRWRITQSGDSFGLGKALITPSGVLEGSSVSGI